MVQTIKTAVVVVLLLAVCYGAFVALNAPEPDVPASISDWLTEGEHLEGLGRIDMGESSVSIDPGQLMSDLQGSHAGSPNPPPAAANIGLPVMTGVPNNSAPSGSSLPAFPALPNESSTNFNASTAMPGLSSEVDVESFPPLQATPPSTTPNVSLVGDQRPANSGRAMGSPGNLIPEMLDTPEEAQLGGQSQPAWPSESPANDSQSSPTLPTVEFSTARAEALKLAQAGELRAALAMLTAYYDSPELGYDERTDLVDILDALCKEVIYSKRHLLGPAYVVNPQDTVASVAQAHHISPEFLNAINGLGDSKALVPGSKLKVVEGPFRAVVSLSRGELTLFLGDLYAARFPFSTGKEPAPRTGNFAVVDRRQDRTYYGAGGGTVVVPGEDPRNPYGGYWLHLGEDLCIHGTPVMASSDLENAGCISLAPIDAKDVYNILVLDSQVEIRP